MTETLEKKAIREFLIWLDDDITYQNKIYSKSKNEDAHHSCILVMRLQQNKLEDILKKYGVSLDD